MKRDVDMMSYRDCLDETVALIRRTWSAGNRESKIELSSKGQANNFCLDARWSVDGEVWCVVEREVRMTGTVTVRVVLRWIGSALHEAPYDVIATETAPGWVRIKTRAEDRHARIAPPAMPETYFGPRPNSAPPVAPVGSMSLGGVDLPVYAFDMKIRPTWRPSTSWVARCVNEEPSTRCACGKHFVAHGKDPQREHREWVAINLNWSELSSATAPTSRLGVPTPASECVRIDVQHEDFAL